MGYYVRIDECSVSIPKSRFSEACRILSDNGFLSESTSNEDLPGILGKFGFECFYDEDGGISDLFYDQRSGNEASILNALAPFFSEGDYIQWEGEDREVWRYEFRDGTMKHLIASTVWREAENTP